MASEAELAEMQRGDAPELPGRPYLKPWYRLAQTDGRLILEYGHSTVVFEGKAVEKLLPALLPSLDGTRTIGEINESLGEEAAPAIANALTKLTERGVLTDGPPLSEDTPAAATETAQFLSAVSEDGRTVSETMEGLRRAAVSVVGAGPVAREIAKLLSGAGVERVSSVDWGELGEGPDSPDLVIAAPEPSELPQLEDWNHRAIETRIPWLQILPFDGRFAAVGPLYVPGDSCCYECFRRRRAANVTYPTDDYWALQKTPAPYPWPPALGQMVAGLAATLALQWLSDRAAGETASRLSATMHAVTRGETVDLTRHTVYRVPRCPVCFPDDLGLPSPWHQ